MSRIRSRLGLVCCCGLFLLFASACKQKQENPVTQYGDTLINSYKGAQNAAEQANLDAVRKAISAYRAANEGYPKSLQDIGNLIGSPIDLSGYDYDTATGTVTLKPKQ